MQCSHKFNTSVVIMNPLSLTLKHGHRNYDEHDNADDDNICLLIM